MKQLIQNKKSGDIELAELPSPARGDGLILVKNCYSVISAGTEKSTIESRKSSLFSRATSQPDELKKVLEEVRKNGLLKTYRRVMFKLDSSAAFGYSSSGVVVAVDPSVR